MERFHALLMMVLVIAGISVLEVKSEKYLKDLPSYFPRCYRDDPKMNECLLKATATVKPFLKKGVPEMNLPSISPFVVPEITLQQGTRAVNYKAIVKNLKITGMDEYEFTKFEYDLDKLKFSTAFGTEFVNIQGGFEISGNVLTVPITGDGSFEANITASNGTLDQQVEIHNINGTDYLEPKETTLKLNIGDVTTSSKGLFGGNEVLATAVHNLIRDNMKVLIEEIRPAIEEVITRIVQDIVFRSLSRIPYNKLYPVHGKLDDNTSDAA